MHVLKIKTLLSEAQLRAPEVLDAQAEALRCPALVALVCQALQSSGGEHKGLPAYCIACCRGSCAAAYAGVCSGPQAPQSGACAAQIKAGSGSQHMSMLQHCMRLVGNECAKAGVQGSLCQEVCQPEKHAGLWLGC